MIYEPMTVLTDCVLAGVCATLAVALKRAQGGQVVRGWWAAAFGMLAVAALLGGAWHGFAPHLGLAASEGLWKATVYAVGLFNLGMLGGGIVATTTGRLRRTLMGAAVLKFAVFALATATRDGFEIVVADSAGSMIGLALLHGWLVLDRGDRGSRWVLAAIAVSALAALVQYARVGPAAWFNHNDLYHVIQAVAMLLFYAGGRILTDRQDGPNS